MATTRLSDVVQIPVYNSYTALNNPETSEFVTSGVIARNPVATELAGAAAISSTVPFWNDLDPNVEPNYSNDDPTDIATVNKVTSGTQVVRKSWLNQIYGAMDLARELSTSDPMRHIKNRFGEYWKRQLQRRTIASAIGVMNDNAANDGGDMRISVASQTNAGITANTRFTRANFVNAAFTMGDQVDRIRVIAVHSMVLKQMVNNDDIDYIPDSQGQLTIPTFMGRRVVVDDGMPVIAGTTDATAYNYVSILFGAGAFGFGQGTPLVPSWVDREEKAGNGGGMEEIGEREEWVLHPNGFSWIEGTLTEFSPQLSDLRLAAHWDRKAPRKFVPMAFLVTN